MRTTLLAIGRDTRLNLGLAASRRDAATRQLSSGLRVTRPSDSPGDAAGVVRTNSDIAKVAQLQRNLGAAQSELRAVDGALFDAVDVLHRALSLGTQGATDTQDASGRKTISIEVDSIKRHVLTIANTVYAGRHLFGGSLDSQPPFEADPSTSAVSYNGDSASRSIRFPDGRPGAISLPGDAIFLTQDVLTGSGRTAATAGGQPAPPVGVGVSFAGDVQGTISADLTGFFVASSAPAGAAAGDTVSVTLVSDDGAINETITTAAFAGGEDATAIAALLNAEIAANSELAGNFSFSNEGGALKLTQSDAVGQGFSFTSSSSGLVVSGLEAGGVVGGYSAQEIAAALNQQVALDSQLNAAGVRFSVVGGEVQVDARVDVVATAADFSRGTAFASGLAGTHRVGGADSANVFGALTQLVDSLQADDQPGIAEAVANLQRAVGHISRSQGFFGGTLRQLETSLNTLGDIEVVNQERLSSLRDADIVQAIGEFQAASTAEELAIQIAGRQRPNLLDVLG